MDIDALFILIPLSLLIIAIAVIVFLRMNHGGQFDDPESPAYSIILDDDRPANPESKPARTDKD